MPPPAHRAEIVTEDRPGGYKMPLLRTNGEPVRRHEYDTDKARIETVRRQIRNGSLTR